MPLSSATDHRGRSPPRGAGGHRDALWLAICTGLGLSHFALAGREWLPRRSSGPARRKGADIMAGQGAIRKADEKRRGETQGPLAGRLAARREYTLFAAVGG